MRRSIASWNADTRPPPRSRRRAAPAYPGARSCITSQKAQLLATAVEDLFDRRRAEFLAALAVIDPAADRLDAAIDLLWSMFQGPAFVAWSELWMAARTDPELAASVVAVERRFTAESRMFTVIFPPGPEADELLGGIARDFAFAVLTGVATQRLFPHGERPASDYLDAIKRVFRLARLQV